MQHYYLTSFDHCGINIPEIEGMGQTVTLKGLKGHPGLNPESGVKNLPRI